MARVGNLTYADIMNSGHRPLWADIALGIVAGFLLLYGLFMGATIAGIFLVGIFGGDGSVLLGLAVGIVVLYGAGLLARWFYHAYRA